MPIDRFAVGHNESSSEEVRVTTNDWVEDIINAFRGSLEDKIDPLKVPDQSVSFDRRIVGVRFHGKLFICCETVTKRTSCLLRTFKITYRIIPETKRF